MKAGNPQAANREQSVSRRKLVNSAALTAFAAPAASSLAGLFAGGGVALASGQGLGDEGGSGMTWHPNEGALPTSRAGVVVTDFGARGDGKIDDTKAVQAAIDAVEEAGGGVVVFPAGTFRCNMLIGPKVWLQGSGYRVTTLQSVAGSNKDVIKGREFDELACKAHANGDYKRGSYGVVIRDVSIDGDRSNNAAGFGIRLWGADLTFQDVIVRNCVEDGIYTEFTDQDNITDLDEHIEGAFGNVKSMGHGGNGFTHRGPHDSILTNFFAFNNDGWALKSETATDKNCGYIGGISINSSNSYLNKLGSFYIGSSTVSISNTIASGPFIGTGIEIAPDLGALLMTGVLILGHETGLWLRGNEHTFSGAILSCHNSSNTAGNGINIDGAGGCLIDVTGSDNHNAILISSETSPNIVRGIFNVASDKTLVSGNMDSVGSYYQLMQYGAAGNDAIGTNPFRTKAS